MAVCHSIPVISSASWLIRKAAASVAADVLDQVGPCWTRLWLYDESTLLGPLLQSRQRYSRRRASGSRSSDHEKTDIRRLACDGTLVSKLHSICCSRTAVHEISWETHLQRALRDTARPRSRIRRKTVHPQDWCTIS